MLDSRRWFNRLLGPWFDKRERFVSNAVERRRFPRIRSRDLIRFCSCGNSKVERLYNLADLSEAGFRIWTDLGVSPGTLLDAVVNLNEKEIQLPIKIQVIWVSGSQGWHAAGRQMGVESTGVSEKHRRVLRQLVLEKLFSLHAA